MHQIGWPEPTVTFGYEDGGTTIYGRRAVDHSGNTCTWTFWLASSGLGIDDNGEEVYVTHRSEETTDLASILPDALFCYRPFLIYPDFTTVLREAFDEHKAESSSHKVYPDDEYQILHWERLIAASDQKTSG